MADGRRLHGFDLSSASVALATCAAVVGSEPDDLRVIEALRRRGVQAVHAAWDAPDVDWSCCRLTVIRSTWDYIERRDEFLAWAETLPKVLNPAPILRWNTEKRYLGDLVKAGLPVVPTHFLEPGAAFEPPSAPFVIKPTVSLGAKDAARYRPGEEAVAREHVQRLQIEGRTVMVQPYLSRIDETGEVGVIFIGGRYSHSIRRGPLLLEGQPPGHGSTLPLNVQAHEPSPTERASAEQVIRHLAAIPTELLYARVDLVPGPTGEPLILEVELTEPSLFLEFSDNGADRLADAIAAALESGSETAAKWG